MDIGINILPKEMRAKPLINLPTAALLIVILLLVFGSIYYYYDKTSSQNDTASMQKQITTMQQQATALSTNPQALNLINSINQAKVATQSYNAFVASKVRVGYSLVGVYANVPAGIDITQITQSGNTLVITGTTPTYTEVSDYGRDLNNDPRFTLMGMPSFSGGRFSLTVKVEQGGAQ